MKNWKSFLLRLPIYALIVAALGFGIWKFVNENKLPDGLTDVVPTVATEANTDLMPEQVIGIGDTFEYWPSKAKGHMLCRITGARVVRSAAECPPEELFVEGGFWDDGGKIDYENWFADGGAYDQGCRVVLVELELTNVDATALLSDGSLTMTDGWFSDAYAFLGYDVINLANLSVVYKTPETVDYQEYLSGYCSYYGEYAREDDRETLGVEPFAVRIEPGKTVTYTLGFLLPGKDGKAVDLTMLRAIRGADSDTKTGLFIDLGLENV